MSEINQRLTELTTEYRTMFKERQAILSFGAYMQRLQRYPLQLIRCAATYLRDTFDYFGTSQTLGAESASVRHFKLFDSIHERCGPIIGGEIVHGEIYSILNNFVRQGVSNKLILLHGPNGSSKSSTLEIMSHAMGRYSETDAGAVYRFNWIFPTEKSANPRAVGESGPIGFGGKSEESIDHTGSYALIDEAKIASKIFSEYKDNPVFLLPMPQREIWLREWISTATGIKPEDVELPPHILQSGLSKKNQMILENLLAAYDGDLSRVLRHVQVERFYYSRQYRVGVASVEPRMSIDAIEKQLTMDNNMNNLPSILHNMRFFEAFGPLIEANRGMLEFSDMLKRPVESFKYLLTTVEKGVLDLPSSTAQLDVVFFGSTNEKHLDAFKTSPDFASFRGRFELVTVPYLLRPTQEIQIYQNDLRILRKIRTIAPHSAELLCAWAVMTRLKQPDPENYEGPTRGLIARLDPRCKIRLYEGQSLQPFFKPGEENTLRDLKEKIEGESRGVVIYEGRFGASPREVRAILYRAAQNEDHATLTPMAIFDELEKLIRDRTVYEFLQYEARGKYHDAAGFINVIKEDFAHTFEHECLLAMTLVEEEQYDILLRRYVENVVAFVKKERLYNSGTSTYEEPSQSLMNEVERIIGITSNHERHREGMLGRIAGYKIGNPKAEIVVTHIFHDYLRKIQDHYHAERTKVVDDNFRAMMLLDTPEQQELKPAEEKLARTTYQQLQQRFGYDKESARESLKFLANFKKQKK